MSYECYKQQEVAPVQLVGLAGGVLIGENERVSLLSGGVTSAGIAPDTPENLKQQEYEQLLELMSFWQRKTGPDYSWLVWVRFTKETDELLMLCIAENST